MSYLLMKWFADLVFVPLANVEYTRALLCTV